MNIEKVIDLLSNGKSDERINGFIKYYANKLWAEYNEYLMNEIVVIENKVKDLFKGLFLNSYDIHRFFSFGWLNIPFCISSR